ncbi:MAG: hypothetical protein RQ767_01290 [Thermovirgaceae bacterium]|nr:hypothetical protein [Thermovirgaceae bacterium]
MMEAAGVTGISGAKISRIMKGPWVFLPHKWTGIDALAFGTIHAMIHQAPRILGCSLPAKPEQRFTAYAALIFTIVSDAIQFVISFYQDVF